MLRYGRYSGLVLFFLNVFFMAKGNGKTPLLEFKQRAVDNFLHPN